MGLSISISAPKLKLFQRKLVTLQMHESAAVDPPTRHRSWWRRRGRCWSWWAGASFSTPARLSVLYLAIRLRLRANVLLYHNPFFLFLFLRSWNGYNFYFAIALGGGLRWGLRCRCRFRFLFLRSFTSLCFPSFPELFHVPVSPRSSYASPSP